MVKQLQFKMVLLLCALVAGVSSAWAEDKTITIEYDSSFSPALPSASNSVNSSATEHTVNGLSIKEAGIYKGSSNSYLMFVQNSGYLYNTVSLGTIKSVAVTYSSGTSTSGKAGVYFGSSEVSTYTTSSNQTIAGQSQTDTWTNSTSGNGYFQLSTSSKNCQITKIVITYDDTVSDGRAATTITISDTGITNTDFNAGSAAGSLSATVMAGETAIDGATVTWSGDKDDVATINATTGVVTLVGEGSVTFTATYDGDATNYKPSTATINLTITDSSIITLWSEDFSSYSADDVPSGGTYSYTCTDGGGTTKIYNQASTGGSAPELLVGKNQGTFKAIVPLNNASGNLTLTYKTNAKTLKVSTSTTNISIKDAAQDGSISFTTSGTHTVTFTGVTTSMTSITIVFTATSSDNVRLDDILLRGNAQAATVEAPQFNINGGTYYTSQTVTLSCATEGATIYYSNDNTNWNEYEEAINVSTTTTLYAKAVKGSDESTVSSISITIAEKNDVVFNITDKLLAYGETYTITRGTNSGRDVQTDGTVTVSSSNDAVASVSGMTITPVAVGTATITITAAEGDTYKVGSTTITVTITAPSGLTTAPEITALFKETFSKAAGTGPSGDSWSGSIASAAFKSDNEGWSGNSPYSGSGCARFGTSNADGSATTPAIAFDGTTTYNLTFKAGAWNGDGTTLTVTCNDENAVIGTGNDANNTKAFTMLNNAWTTFNTTIKAAAGSKITFATSSGRFFLDDVIVTDPNATGTAITATLNASGYATFCSQYPLDFTNATDYSAWQITDISNTNEITFERITGSIKGGQGIFLKGTAGATVTLTSADSDEVLGYNLLEGTLAPTYVEDGKFYGLSGGNFVKINGGTVKAGKAILDAEWITESNDSRLTFIFTDEAAGISEIEHPTLKNDDSIYNLQGRRVNNPTKGLYIINGKKIVKN